MQTGEFRADAQSAVQPEITVSDYIGEFNAILKELLAAYETRDSVLVGDLAEYELAPRLRCLYAALTGPKVAAA